MIHKVIKFGSVLWLLIIALLCVLAFQKKASFDTSIMALLPKHEQNNLLAEAQETQTKAYSKQLFIVVSSEKKASARTAVEFIRSTIKPLQDVLTLTQSEQSYIQQSNGTFDYRFSILSATVRQRLIEQKFNDQLQSSLSKLLYPIGTTQSDTINDPFSLYTDFLLDQNINADIQIENGMLRLTNLATHSYLVSLEIKSNPFSLSTQERVMPVLQTIKNELHSRKVRALYSGLILHAAKGAEQAKFEISTIGLGSILGITLLIMIVFRRMSALITVLLPVAIGCLVAITTSILWFDQVHIITIAFGAGLVGVAVDYSMHFACESQLVDSRTVIRKLFPGLTLGLVSSVFAYGGLALAPFPGLQQIAFFSAIGLIAAWVTVLIWLPWLPSVVHQPLLMADTLNRWRTAFPRLDNQNKATVSVCMILLLSGFVNLLYLAEPQDGIRHLQTSPLSLLEEDKAVQKALNTNINPAFLVVTGDDIETTLQKEEAFREYLDQQIKAQRLSGYQAISEHIPSTRRQQNNLQLVGQLYQSVLPIYLQTLSLSDTQKTSVLDSFANSQTTLAPEKWLLLPSSTPYKNHLIRHSTGEVSTVIRLLGTLDQSLVANLQQQISLTSSISYIDPVGNIGDTLGRYRIEITEWLIIAYCVIGVLLSMRYKKDTWRIMLPPIVGSIAALTFAVFLNGGFNLFNLIALMLVFGIGLDMGIFLLESKSSTHTWLAVSLSTFTSILAFGLLALSNTPVLYHFGVIVLPGLLLIWILSPFMQKVENV